MNQITGRLSIINYQYLTNGTEY